MLQTITRRLKRSLWKLGFCLQCIHDELQKKSRWSKYLRSVTGQRSPEKPPCTCFALDAHLAFYFAGISYEYLSAITEEFHPSFYLSKRDISKTSAEIIHFLSGEKKWTPERSFNRSQSARVCFSSLCRRELFPSQPELEYSYLQVLYSFLTNGLFYAPDLPTYEPLALTHLAPS